MIGRVMPPASAKKLLLIAWDAAEWELIAPLLDEGRLPHLARLVQSGVLARLDSLSPGMAAPLWTSVATGRRPEQHGILGDLEPGENNVGTMPVASHRRRGSTVWEIVARAGRPALVVDWPATWPQGVDANLVVAAQGKVSRPQWAEDVAELQVGPGEFTREDLAPFVTEVAQLEPRDHPPLAALMAQLARATSTQTVATYLLENEPWNCAAVHFGVLGEISRDFLEFTPPRLPQVTEADFARYSGVVTQALILHDQMLGRLLELAGGDCAVLLASADGWLTGTQRPALEPGEHAYNLSQKNPRGWAVLRAPGLRQDEIIYGGSILDLAPTALWLLGLPVALDCPGRPWVHACVEPPSVPAVPTHEAVALGPPAWPEGNRVIAAEWRLAFGSYLHGAGRAAEALPWLEESVAAFPERIGPVLQLIGALVTVGRFADAHRWVEVQAARPEGGLRTRPGQRAKIPPQFDFIRGVIAQGEGRLVEALRHYECALGSGAQTAELHTRLGRALLGLHRWTEARAAFARGLAIDAESAAVHYGLAVAAYRLRDFAAAADHALDASMRRTEPPEFHLLLGLALGRVGRREEAITALRHTLARQPTSLLAHRALVALHRKIPSEAFLAETHRLAVASLRRRPPES